MKNPLAFFLAIVACVLATVALLTGRAQAGDAITYNVGTTVVRTQILDDSKSPEIVLQLICTGDTVDGVVGPCRAELLKQCPDGGTVMAIEETPEGFTPLGLALVVRCIHEAEADEPAAPEPSI